MMNLKEAVESGKEATAPRVECAEKIDVTTPASLSRSLIQRPTVEGETGLKGFVEPINTTWELDSLREGAVAVM